MSPLNFTSRSTSDGEAQQDRAGHPRRGIALATALIVIVLLGTLVAGAVYFTNQDARAASNSRRLQQSFGVAEGGVAEVIRGWVPGKYAYRGDFPSDTAPVVLTGLSNKTGAYQGSIYKLNSKMYLVDVTGRDSTSIRGGLYGGGGARQRVAMLMRVVPLKVDIKSALTIGGPVIFGGGNVFIDGSDHVPPAWTNCGAMGDTLAGVRAKNAGDVASSSGQVKGKPNVLIDPAMDSTTFMQFGPTNYAMLASQATINSSGGSFTPTPSLTGGKCNYADLNNWGDGKTPTNPCGSYYPVIHIAGSANIANGQGQGILLVDGNLVASGTFTFYGMVIVRGGFSTVAGGNPKIYGTVLAQSLNLATTAFAGDAVVDYSQCAVQRTMDATGVGAPLRSRSWVRVM